VNGRTQKRVDGAMAAIRSYFANISAANASVDGILGDFSGPAGSEAVIAKLAAVDVLVNNIGTFEPKPFTVTTTVFHCFTVPAVRSVLLCVVETTFSSKFESHSHRQFYNRSQTCGYRELVTIFARFLLLKS
jgi:hypothetical protein